MKLNRVLFVGVGGGNDIFSTTLAMASLWDIGWRWEEAAIAGVLSPFHIHNSPQAANNILLTSESSTRHLLRRGNERINYVDAEVCKMIEREPLCLCSSTVYGISLKNGSRGVQEAFKFLEGEFDYFVLVDIGGDCFYNGTDPHVLSPMFDSITLKGFIDSGCHGTLFEAGPGTDGELSPETLRNVLADSDIETHPINSESVDWWEALYRKWIARTRYGNTVPATISAFRATEPIMTREYYVRGHLGMKRYHLIITQLIDTLLCKQFFLVPPEIIQNPFMVDCSSAYDWFLKTQVAQKRTNNEANLEYFKSNGKLCQFLTPSPLFEENQRRVIFKDALLELVDGMCDSVFCFTSDLFLAEIDLLSKFLIIPVRENFVKLEVRNK